MKSEEKRQVFTEHYLAIHPQLERYCRVLIKNKDEASDLMSEAVVIAYEKFEKMREPSKLKYFLFGTVSRLFTKSISRRKEFTDYNDAKAVKLIYEETDASEKSDIHILYKALSSLPDNEKEIIALFELSGFSLLEISELKQMNINTVKTHLSRGRSRLVRILNPNNTEIYE